MTALAERDRRWAALRAAMLGAGCDALVLASNDFRGHKGAVRWVSDFRLHYRHAFVLFTTDADPILILLDNFRDGIRSPWLSDHRFSGDPAAVLRDLLRDGGRRSVGIVGLNGVMRVADYRTLYDGCPSAGFFDGGPLFDSVRVHKGHAEIAGIAEAANIADECFSALLDIARPGVSERDMETAMLHRNATLGGEDALFLTMGMTVENGVTRPYMGPPRDIPLSRSTPFIFSFEMTGPAGYWTELARVITFEAPTPDLVEAVDQCSRAMEAAFVQLRPGAVAANAHNAALEAIDAELFQVGPVIGHSIGQDVIEAPLIGAGVQDRIEAGMAFAVHPRMRPRRSPHHVYMADICVVHAGGAQQASRWPREIYQCLGGERR